MELQEAFERAKEDYPFYVLDDDLLEASGFRRNWSLVDAAAVSGDPSRRGQLVLSELRFNRCYDADEAQDDRFRVEEYPRNHWGFTCPDIDLVVDREAARQRAFAEYAGGTLVWEVQ